MSKPPIRTTHLFWWVLICCALAHIGVAVTLRHLPISLDPRDGDSNILLLRHFWIAAGISWLALSVFWFVLRRCQKVKDHGPRASILNSWWISILVILIVAVIGRAMVIIGPMPGLSDDVWRYILDGRNIANGINPYTASPIEYTTRRDSITVSQAGTKAPAAVPETQLADWPGQLDISRQVNNPTLHTVYLPTSQMTFAAIAAVIELNFIEQGNLAANARVYRAVFATADLLIIAILFLILHLTKRSLWWTILYAWHPLPLAEFAGAGHQDVVGIFLMLSAVGCGLWKTRSNTQRPKLFTAAILIAMSTFIKPFAAPAGAFILRGSSVRTWLLSIVLGCATLMFLTLPFLTLGGNTTLIIANIRDTSSQVTLKWAHFGSVYEPLLYTIEAATNEPDLAWQQPDTGYWSNDQQEQLARLVCSIMIIIIMLLLWWRCHDLLRAMMLCMFVMVLFTPAAHPWYLLWAFVFFPTRPILSLWIASLTISWGYAAWGFPTGEDGPAWQAPTWVMIAAWLPVWLALIYDYIGWNRRRKIAPVEHTL